MSATPDSKHLAQSIAIAQRDAAELAISSKLQALGLVAPLAASPTQDFTAMLLRLTDEFKKHPQLKSVIGREALILRCVDAARGEASQAQAEWIIQQIANLDPKTGSIGTAVMMAREYKEQSGQPLTVGRAALSEFCEKFCLNKPELVACAESAFYWLNKTLSGADWGMKRDDRRSLKCTFCETQIPETDPGLFPHPNNGCPLEITQFREKSLPMTTGSAHPDDLAIDRFAVAMKAKMAVTRAQGRAGWNDPEQCPIERLQSMLVACVAKGDPVDVGNMAMMISARGGMTVAMSQAQSGDEQHAALKALCDNHAETLRSIAKMDPLTDGDRMRQWARDALSGYIETNEATMVQLMDKLAEWERLRDPAVLHASLLRGLPAKLSRDEILHIAGDGAAEACKDANRLTWLQEQVVDTIYLDDGRIVDVRGGDVRATIDEAMMKGDIALSNRATQQKGGTA